MNTLITIASYNNALKANIIRGKLESESIPATLANEQYVTANWMISNAVGGIQLQVPPAYEQQAQEILKEIDDGEHMLTEQDNVDVLVCPSCQSDKVKKRREFWKISLLTFHLLAIPSPFSQHDYRCKNCKHQWSDENQAEYSTGTIVLYSIVAALATTVAITGFFLLLALATN